jgi:hypothetical protein
VTERTRKKIVYLLLVGAIVYGAYNFRTAPKPAAVDQAGSITVEAGATVQAAVPALPDLTDLKARPWGRDPFGSKKVYTVAPKIGGPAPVRLSWTLTGVVYNERHPLAVISGMTVGVGDMVNQARVIQIEKNKVTLEYNGSRFDIFVTKG